MRIALLAGALAVTLAASTSVHADSSILTYRGSLDRAGHYVMPGLTHERAGQSGAHRGADRLERRRRLCRASGRWRELAADRRLYFTAGGNVYASTF
jgi:hypothetical protein